MSISIYIKKIIISLIFFSLNYSLASQQISSIDESNLFSLFNKRVSAIETTIKEKLERFYEYTKDKYEYHYEESCKNILKLIINDCR